MLAGFQMDGNVDVSSSKEVNVSFKMVDAISVRLSSDAEDLQFIQSQ